LSQSVSELRDGQFALQPMGRELGILAAIAEFHGLGAQFREHVKRARKNLRRPLEGNAISRKRVYLDAELLGIRSVYDAAHATHTLHSVSDGLRLTTLAGAAINSLHYQASSLRRGVPLPPPESWISPR